MNDTPVTDKELDSFYGTPPTQAEINEAILRQKRAFDADDLATIAQENYEHLLWCLQNGGNIGVWDTFRLGYQYMIADRASIELYGRVGVIKPEKV